MLGIKLELLDERQICYLCAMQPLPSNGTLAVHEVLLFQVDVFHHASDRVSSAAELYGAVQQEARISRAIDIMLLHVDNVKRMHEKDRTDLEEAKK